MGDEEAAPYVWTSLEPLMEGQDEAPSGGWVKSAGRSKVTYPNGDTFEGTFNEALQKHGRGTYTWSTGVGANPWVPEGDGFPEGKAPTVKYEGQYVEGRKCGIGKLSLPNGDRYHGSFSADAFEGEGSYFYANGDIYSGAWKAGEKVGQGTFFFAKDESQIVGSWVKGQMVTGKWIWKDGTSWHGPFKNSQPIGRGIFYFTSGLVQEGEYVVEGEGDAEDPDAIMKATWKGGAVRVANAAASEIVRAN